MNRKQREQIRRTVAAGDPAHGPPWTFKELWDHWPELRANFDGDYNAALKKCTDIILRRRALEQNKT